MIYGSTTKAIVPLSALVVKHILKPGLNCKPEATNAPGIIPAFTQNRCATDAERCLTRETMLLTAPPAVGHGKTGVRKRLRGQPAALKIGRLQACVQCRDPVALPIPEESFIFLSQTSCHSRVDNLTGTTGRCKTALDIVPGIIAACPVCSCINHYKIFAITAQPFV